MKAEYKQRRAAKHSSEKARREFDDTVREKAKPEVDDMIADYVNGDCCWDCLRKALKRLAAEDAVEQEAIPAERVN
jgi:hypothetical protein